MKKIAILRFCLLLLGLSWICVELIRLILSSIEGNTGMIVAHSILFVVWIALTIWYYFTFKESIDDIKDVINPVGRTTITYHETEEIFKAKFPRKFAYGQDTTVWPILYDRDWLMEDTENPDCYAVLVDLGNGYWRDDGRRITKPVEIRKTKRKKYFTETFRN